MAVYEYLCPKCRNVFELMRPMSDSGKPAKCPKCGSKAERLISGFGSKTGSYLQTTEKAFRGKALPKPTAKSRASKASAGKGRPAKGRASKKTTKPPVVKSRTAKSQAGKAKATSTARIEKGRKK